MTPKEKAKQLVESMAFSCRECDYEARAKQCALMAVDEIIASNPRLVINWAFSKNQISDNIIYWQEVKQEIEKI